MAEVLGVLSHLLGMGVNACWGEAEGRGYPGLSPDAVHSQSNSLLHR